MVNLEPLRAARHRDFIGPEFGGGPAGEDPRTLSYAEIIVDPRLSALGNRVYNELRLQFAKSDAVGTETEATEAYRRKLEGWADMLEILLEETLAELETLGSSGQPVPGEF